MSYILVSPSLLAADFAHLQQEVERMEQAGADWLHLDVMDGQFVPNISFGMPVIASIRPYSRLLFDTHLMIKNPLRYIDAMARAGADSISFHYESDDNPQEVLQEIKKHNLKACMAVSPKTPIEAVYPFLSQLDMVLIMTVEPGFGGQKLIPETTSKIVTLHRYAKENHMDHLFIQVDGGINTDNVQSLLDLGANVVVVGSAIFRSADPCSVMTALRGE